MQTVTRRHFLALSGGTLALAAIPGAWAARLGRSAGFFPWTELASGVHATVDQSLGGNSMVITSGGEALLVDTKFPAFAAALAREAAGFGAEVTRIINTHHHGDHTGGNAVLNAQAEILAHAGAIERIRAQFDRYTGMAKGGPRQVDQARDGADQVLADAQAAAQGSAGWTAESAVPDTSINAWPHEMAVGDIKLVLHHFGPGHTDNDLVVHLPELNMLHTGDLCFHGLHPFFDPTGGVTCRGWSRSVGRVMELCDRDTKVVPGHGAITDVGGLKAQREYLDSIWEAVSKEVAAGTPREDVLTMSWDFMDGLGFEQVRERAIGAVYDEAKAAG